MCRAYVEPYTTHDTTSYIVPRPYQIGLEHLNQISCVQCTVDCNKCAG